MISYPLTLGPTTIRVIESGSGATPIVFIHGVSAYAHRWSRNLDALATTGYRCYAIDLPGHGFATKGGAFDYSVSGYADVLDAFLRSLGSGPAVLVGTSLGGHIAATLACRKPDSVRALVLAGCLGLVPVGAESRGMIAIAIRDTTRDGIRAKLVRAHADPSHITAEWVEEEFRLNNSDGAADTFERLAVYIAQALDDDCAGAALAPLVPRIPTLLLWGEHDRSVGLAVATAVHAMLAGAHLVVIRNAAHAPYFERPEQFNTAVRDFLSGALDDHPPGEPIYR